MDSLIKPLTTKKTSNKAAFGRHETFALRYSWLTKGFQTFQNKPDIFSSDDDLFDIAEVTGKVSNADENTFKPWHKPRKQFIRENQWFNPLQRIAKSNKYNTINTINYFGLPGGDLLDVTYISQKLSAHNELSNKDFLIHGFINNVSEFKKAQSGLSQLLDRKNVCKNSKVENFFCSIMCKKLQAGCPDV